MTTEAPCMRVASTSAGALQTARAIMQLARPRLTLLVMAATAVAYLLSCEEHPVRLWHLAQTAVATGLLAAGAGAINQYMERARDALMVRTAHRPLPTRALSPTTALAIGLTCVVTATAQLALVAGAAAVAGGVAVLIYLLLYTPLKRISPVNTLVGALAGAVPALVGCTATAGRVTPAGLALFLIMFLWQMPHFLAVAVIYADDYARAGFRMLTSESGGAAAGRQMVLYSLALIPVTLLPAAQGLAGMFYAAAALAAGLVLVFMSVRCARRPDRRTGRGLLVTSVLHLTVVMLAMVLDVVV